MKLRKLNLSEHGFSFIVPMTLAIIVGFCIMAIGAFVIGEVTTTLENSFPAAASRTTRQNDTLTLLGNVTNGFGDVIDIEIVVIIITALSMAIFAVMAVGSRRSL
jgi:hypothetical protein